MCEAIVAIGAIGTGSTQQGCAGVGAVAALALA
jgi:hypothetical protein